MILQVYVGENLNYTVGRLHYSSDADVNPTTSETTTIIIFAAIATVMILIIILLVVVIICGVRKKSKKSRTIAFTGNTDVNMYASPAYGTHQIFTEPGMDHLYEPIDEYHKENTTTLQDTASPTDDDEIDADGYLKMKPSCEVVDQDITKGSIVVDSCSTFIGGEPNDEYVQPLDNVPVNNIKGDDGDNDGDEDNKSDNKNDDIKDDDKDSHDKIDHNKDNEVNEDDKDDDGKDDRADKDDDKGNDKDDDDGYDKNDQKSMNTEK